MKRNAFTLIELLVVIAIIALLAILMIPTVNSALSIARNVECTSNLNEIGKAFGVAQLADNSRNAPLYPTVYQWPEIPQTAVGNGGIFMCPEDATPLEEKKKETGSNLEDYALFLQQEKGGMYISFKTTDARPYRLVFDRGSYWEFWFEDGRLKDIDGGVDFVFHVTKTRPHVAEFQDVPHNTPRITSLTFKEKTVPGWENLSLNAKGDDVIMGGSGLPCDYGLNRSVAGRTSVAPDTIVVLDYDAPIANYGENVSENLEAGARHMGKNNVLYGSGSVSSHTPIELDPLMAPGPWRAD
ncbi:MAG: prepilin-type N-terminal cleavage/methylation domain-containing protein [Phycisphaerales bacterium]|jgi:prepilin-type N-terminal cleavage/methylation domain-containing protein|nr:prepilin-type N-terminal cleavage/methylation domain-containing protein [Phycisphaerales bacterium]